MQFAVLSPLMLPCFRYDWKKGTKAVFKFIYDREYNEEIMQNIVIFDVNKMGKARIGCGGVGYF